MLGPVRKQEGSILSVEGGITGNQHKLTCPDCKKVFTAWRPDTAPGVKVKCYFCKTEVEDEAARRPRPEPAPAAAPATPATPAETPAAPAATAAPAAPESAPAAPAAEPTTPS